MGERSSPVEDVVVDPVFWSGRRVLVTGHTGFKGAWLSLWLSSLGAEVVGFSRGAPTAPSLFELSRLDELVESFAGDVRDGGALRDAVSRARPDVVIHMAAQPLVRRGFSHPVETYETNVMGTVNVLEAARAGEVRAVVVVTTDKCYAERPGGGPHRETDALGGRDPYSSSKACAELVAAAYRDSFFGGGPRLATARAGNVIGGGDWAEDRLVPDLVGALLDGRRLRLRNPDAIRPWQHVLCPLSGYLLLAQALCESDAAADAWNLGPDPEDARPVRWVVERLAGLLGEGLQWEEDRGAGPPEAPHLTLDSSRARSALGWRPAWSLDDALTSIAAWYQGHRAGEDARDLTLGQIQAYASGVPIPLARPSGAR